MVFSERQRIETWSCLDVVINAGSKSKVCISFNGKYLENPISQATGKSGFHFHKFEEHGRVKDLPATFLRQITKIGHCLISAGRSALLSTISLILNCAASRCT